MDKRARSPQTETKKWASWTAVLAALILIFSLLASLVHTGFGTVTVRDIQYLTGEGGLQRALLYIPDSATPQSPAPAIVACHGYNNTAEVQDINAIELSRRGYVVISIDAYRHGLSSETDPSMPAAQGGGTYSALQYLGTLPYVDTSRIGMIGHSMGGINIQAGALRACMEHELDPSIVVPTAVAPTASWLAAGEDGRHVLTDYGVNIALFNAIYDEFYYPDQGGRVNLTDAATATMGFENAAYDTFYRYGDAAALDRDDAVTAAASGELRALHVYPMTHPGIHFSKAAETDIVEFFDITLRGGQTTIAPDQQIWRLKHYFSGIALLAGILLVIPVGGLLLQTRFFSTLVRPEPASYAVVENKKQGVTYVLLTLACMVPSAVLYYFCMAWGNALLSNFLPLACVNGIVVLNVLSALISLAVFMLMYRLVYKKNGASIDNMGVRLPVRQVLKALLLAVLTFAATYGMLVLIDYLFKVDYRFWVFSIRTLTPVKWGIWARYLPFYLVFFLMSGLSLNMTTRIRGKSEVLNTALCFICSAFGLFVLCMLDYGVFFATGYKLFPVVGGAGTSLAGILLWGVIFILPLSALISRFFFKKTGSIWAGAFVNSCVVTLFAVSNTVVTLGALY